MSELDGLAPLAARWGLGEAAVERLANILRLLRDDASAPTTVRDRGVVDVHIADSLSALELRCVRDARAIADLGSGAGFPGVVLAIALERASVALVESVARRCEFLRRLLGAAGVTNARIVHARVEAWPEGLGAHDVVTARALAPLPVLCEYAAPLLALGGSLVAWKARVSAAEADAGERAAAILGLEPQEPVRTEPYAGSVAHRLCVYRKRSPTPPGFPRRVGVARARPLGGAAR